MLVFVCLFLYIFILECTWFILWEQVTSWSHDAAMDATPQVLQTQLKNTHFHILQLNVLFQSGGLLCFLSGWYFFLTATEE